MILSLASDADIPPIFAGGGDDACSADVVAVAGADGEVGGDGTLGFQVAKPAGFGRGPGAGPGAGADDADFSKAAILSRSEPGFGFGGVAGWSDIADDAGWSGDGGLLEEAWRSETGEAELECLPTINYSSLYYLNLHPVGRRVQDIYSQYMY